MRIRKRPPPPQIPSDPNASKPEERPIAARSALLDRHEDLLQGLHGWRRKPDPSPLDSHHQVLQEVNLIICSDNSSGARGPYEDTGDEKPMLKPKATSSTFNDISEYRVEGSAGKKRQSLIMKGSRCSRVNGRGWRCCQETMVGYALCEHHLGKGRLRSLRSMRGSNDQPESMKGRRKIGMLKARSLSSLISECNKTEAAEQDLDVVRAENGDPDGFNGGATQIVPSLP